MLAAIRNSELYGVVGAKAGAKLAIMSLPLLLLIPSAGHSEIGLRRDS